MQAFPKGTQIWNINWKQIITGQECRKNMYRISCGVNCNRENACVIALDDDTVCRLSSGEWYRVISEGLRCCGYVDSQKVANVIVEPCEFNINPMLLFEGH